MFKPVLQAVQMFLKGATGKDRQAKQHLSEHLLTLQVAYDSLQQQHDNLQQQHGHLQQQYDSLQRSHNELNQCLRRNKLDLDEFIDVADNDAKALALEIEDLQHRLRQSEDDKVALQNKNGVLVGRIAFLENKIGLSAYQASSLDYGDAALQVEGEPAPRSDGDKLPLNTPTALAPIDDVDLSNISLALVGGHETTYREVTKELKQYGLKRCVHVPPHSVASSDRNQIKDKISNCDLVVTITSYVDHSVSKCVKSLKDTQMLAGACIRVSCHGKSGLVREVLQYFQGTLQSS